MSVIEKLDSVVMLCDVASAMVPSPEGVAAIKQAETAAADFVIENHDAIRQDMIDAERYRVLRAGLLNEDWTLIEKLSKACPEPRNEAEFDAAIDAARATGEGEGSEADSGGDRG